MWLKIRASLALGAGSASVDVAPSIESPAMSMSDRPAVADGLDLLAETVTRTRPTGAAAAVPATGSSHATGHERRGIPGSAGDFAIVGRDSGGIANDGDNCAGRGRKSGTKRQKDKAKARKAAPSGKISLTPNVKKRLADLSPSDLLATYRPARGRARAKQLATMTPEQIEAERLARLERNRLCARECRARKKAKDAECADRISELEAEATEKSAQISRLQARVIELERKLQIASAHPGSGGTAAAATSISRDRRYSEEIEAGLRLWAVSAGQDLSRTKREHNGADAAIPADAVATA